MGLFLVGAAFLQGAMTDESVSDKCIKYCQGCGLIHTFRTPEG